MTPSIPAATAALLSTQAVQWSRPMGGTLHPEGGTRPSTLLNPARLRCSYADFAQLVLWRFASRAYFPEAAKGLTRLPEKSKTRFGLRMHLPFSSKYRRLPSVMLVEGPA